MSGQWGNSGAEGILSVNLDTGLTDVSYRVRSQHTH